jgi:ABC-type glycerol-3-phosphate transport system substrate-binding protein
MKYEKEKTLCFVIIVALAFLLVTIYPAGLCWAAEKKKLRFATNRTSKPIMAAYEKIIKAFEAKNPDYTVQIEPISWKDQRTYIIGAIASHTEPDVYQTNLVTEIHHAKLGNLLPLDGLMDDIGRKNFYPRILDAITYKGRIWGVPWSATGTTFWYRKDLFAKKGLKAPKTWEDILKCANELTQDTDGDGKTDIYGIVVPYGRNVWTNNYFLSFLWSNGGTVFDKNYQPVINSPKAIETLEYLKKLAKYSPPGSAEFSYKETLMSFVLGKTAMTYYYGRALSTVEKRNPKIMDKLGTFMVKKDKYVSWTAIENMTVMKASKHQEAAKKFIKVFLTDPAYVDILHSVPGHYYPPLKTVAGSKQFLSHPLFKKHPDIFEDLTLAGTQGNYDPCEHPKAPNPNQDIVINTAITQDIVQKVLLKGESPKEALAWGQKKMEETLKEIEKMEK